MTDKPHPSRYSGPSGVEAEFEPGSNGEVLRNKLGIGNTEEIGHVEYEALLAVQDRYYGIITPDTTFTAALLRQMHRDFLGHIYKWAGQYRTVELEKAGFRWPPAHLVAANMAAFERDVLSVRTPCVPGLLDRVAEDIAIVHAEFLVIHPFRDGNGRLGRLVSDLMALQADYPTLDLGITRMEDVERYFAAVQAGYIKDYAQLKRLVAEAIVRRQTELKS